jgi:adenine-specific DNA-methyltransferase
LTKTYGVKYIGSKRELAENILALVKEKYPETETVIDVFSGTTRVAQAFRQNGYRGIASDLSQATEIYSGAFLENENNSHLEDVVCHLNSLEGYSGWLTKNYAGKFWQEKNTKKADAIRDYIETLTLKDWEKKTLITSLIFALDIVDNTVGVQQAYLKTFCKRSYNDLLLKLPPLVEGERWSFIRGNSQTIEYPDSDLAYLDPPYTAHSYATYYNIWDSIAIWDKPKTGLTTARREDRIFSGNKVDESMRSPWNYKAEIGGALRDLIERLPVKNIILSYNNEGLISKEEILDILSKYKIDIISIDYVKNIMTKIGNGPNENADMNNTEYLFCIEK